MSQNQYHSDRTDVRAMRTLQIAGLQVGMENPLPPLPRSQYSESCSIAKPS